MARGHRARPFGLAHVSGPSMSPTLSDGDRVLVRYGTDVRAGSVVLLRHPGRPELLVIKRAVRRHPDGWWVLGDNPFTATGDSTLFGAVPDDLVVATAMLRLRPPAGGRSLRAWLGWARSAVRRLRPDESASERLRGDQGSGTVGPW